METVAALGASERLAAAGAVAVLASLFLPWYGLRVAFRANLVTTGWGAFSFAEAALLLTVGAALAMILAQGQGRELVLPFREGTLLVTAGTWAGLLVFFRLFDRPELSVDRASVTYGPRYGIFLALAGSIVLVIGGIRRRREERATNF